MSQTLPDLRDRFLRDRHVLVAPSILSADFAALGQELDRVQKAGCTWVHLDVMDGHFVPNLTFGPPLVKDLRSSEQTLFFDTHLMIEEPMRYAPQFAEAGADLLTFHQEVCSDLPDAIDQVHELGIYAGISIKPKTPVEAIESILPLVDLVLVMTVEPGFGGQKMIPSCVDKVRRLAEKREKNNFRYLLEVDGGIDPSTASLASRAGAEILVAGSSVFGKGRSITRNVQSLREAVA